MTFFIIFVILILFVIIIFSFPQFSPIPYFPSNKKDLSKIIKALKLKNRQTIIDLGAGDGLVVFESARDAYQRRLDTKFVALDINPILVSIMLVRRFFHPNKKNIRVVLGDMFKKDFVNLKDIKTSVTIYLYISPWYLEKVITNVKSSIKKFSIVSYMYKVPSLKAKEKEVLGKNSIFLYDL